MAHFFRKNTWPNDFMKLESELPNDTQGPTFYNQGLVFSSRKRRCMIAVKRSLFTLSSLRHKTQVQTCSMCAAGLLKPLLVMFTETGWLRFYAESVWIILNPFWNQAKFKPSNFLKLVFFFCPHAHHCNTIMLLTF